MPAFNPSTREAEASGSLSSLRQSSSTQFGDRETYCDLSQNIKQNKNAKRSVLEGGCVVNTCLLSRTCNHLLSTQTLTACGGLGIRRLPGGPPGKLREPASPRRSPRQKPGAEPAQAHKGGWARARGTAGMTRWGGTRGTLGAK